MRKQVRQYLRRSLCGFLSAAMILTGSAISGMTVYAAPPEVENEGEGLTEIVDENTDAAPSEKSENETQNPGDGGSGAADEESGSGSGDALQEDQEEQQPEDGTPLPGDVGSDENGDIEDSDAEGTENDGPEDPGAGDEDVKDPAAEEEAEEDDVKPVIKKDDKGVAALKSAREGYGELVNGDFSEWDGSIPKAWKLSPEYDGQDNFKVNTIDTEHGEYQTLYIWKNAETEISISQVIPNMKPGAYLLAMDAGGIYSKDQITVTIESVAQADENDEEYTTVLDVLVQNQSLGECDGWGKWNTVETEAFKVEVPSEKSEVNIKITISGKIGVGGKEEQFYIDNVTFITYSLADLNTLLTEADSRQETDYTADTWSVFAEKKAAAQSLVNEGAADDTKAYEIMTAYIALKEAMEALQSSSTDADVTFYYYAGETEDEIGLYYWGPDGNISSFVDKADWNVWNEGDTYLMTKVDGYAGWYSIPFTLKNKGEGAGFQVYSKTGAESDDKNSAALYKCDADNNGGIYSNLASGDSGTLAVKYDIGYEGADKTAQVMRNVTLHIYDEVKIPYLQVGNDSSLFAVDEKTGGITALVSEAVDGGNGYTFLPDENDTNWYSLNVSLPGSIQFDSEKVCNLYLKGEEGNSWFADLLNGEVSADVTWAAIDITPVFSGNVYYKDGIFYKTMEEAEAVTLGQLNEFLASEELKKITDKGETGYTAETWAAFSAALAAAQKAASDNSAQPETYTSEAITAAYTDLQSAVKALVSLGADVTLYYYAGNTQDEIGLYYWDNSADKKNLTSTAKKADWNVWGEGDTYLMTAADGYAGWYSIPLTFMNGGADAGFQIFTKTAGTAEDGAQKVPLYKCDAGAENHPEVYEKLTSGDNEMFAVKGGVGYEGADKTAQIMRNVTLHIYNNEKIPYLQVGKDASLSVIDENTGEIKTLVEESVDGGKGYAFSPDEKYDNWYSVSVSFPGSIRFDSEKICNLYVKGNESNIWFADLLNGAVPASVDWNAIDITSVFAGNIYYKDGVFYATMEEAEGAGKITLVQLRKLVDDAKKLKEEDYKKGWENLQTALAAAEAVLKAAADAEADPAKTAPTDEEIEKAYNDLKNAIDALVSKDAVDAEVNVSKIALTDDFITGADLSSYFSLKESGTVFKDEKGNPLSDAAFFRYLREGGTNWVRIRIWNDPYDGSGRGYGGGNNDLEKARIMGKMATDAGMKVLIDFHYSDFWADPAKQQAPKAWKAYSLAEKEQAVYNYTLESLNALRDAGVNVGMVQVGNETNNAICGESSRENMAKIFNAGSRAVRAFDENCLVALHFTNPEKGGYYKGWAASLDEYKVDYDVFASSYYPFWHGTTANLEGVLTEVAEMYGKKVMVAETSWTTSWDDGDGHENTAPRTSQALDYDISLQGQADEIRDVVNAVNNVNSSQPGKAVGVFYWEPAWISPYYVYDEDGKADEKLVKQNQEAWEKYGSGWAASYASEYDPDDAGKWYGGSAVDNQSWFDFDGTALATAKIYSLIRTGAAAEKAISSIGFTKEQNPLEVPLGGEVAYPQATATYNDGTTALLDVNWDQDETELVNTDKAGEYTVHGTVTEGEKVYKLTLTIRVMRASTANILLDPGFEKGTTHPDWKVEGKEGFVSSGEKDWKENPRSGVYAMNFWSQDPAAFSVSQTAAPEAGIYTFGGYIQGDGAGTEDVQHVFAEVSDADGNLKLRREASFTLNGWRNWSNPEITGIEVAEGDSVRVGVTIAATETGTSGVWGSLDDFYLFGTHNVSVAGGIEHGTVETSVVRAESGEKVVVTVTPDEGYYPETMILSGRSITAENCADILTSVNGTVSFSAAGENTVNAAVLTYTAENAEAGSETFTMPNGNVEVGATFKSVFGESTEKIDLSAVENGKYLVQVKADGYADTDPAGENPVPAQFYTGKNVTPKVELSYKGYRLTSADYTAAYENNKNITTADSKAKITLTGKGGRFTGTREILFDINKDTRNEFSAKKLKVVFDASDKNGRTDKAAQAVYYLGKEKEIEPKISLYKNEDDIKDQSKAIDPTLYKVYYQSNRKLGKATLVVLPTDKALHDPAGYKEGSITAKFTIAKCPVNQDSVSVNVSEAPNYYTGRKVEPSVTVTYTYTGQDGNVKTVRLAKGTDYTVSCTNNVNASVYGTKNEDGTVVYAPVNANKQPTLRITGKGNFSGVRSTVDLSGTNNKPGKQKFTFEIRPRDLTELGKDAVTAADLEEKRSAQTLKITVKDGAKKVAASQYEITQITRTHDADGTELAADKAVSVYSKANGTGTAKVKEAGTYKVTIAGKAKANYTGEVETSFRVVDKAYLIPNAKITVSGKFYYTGSPVTLTTTGDTPNLKVAFGSGSKAVVLEAQSSKNSTKDGYYVEYMNRSNINAGKAVVKITGTGRYIGTKTASFTISKRTLVKEITKENERNKKGTLQPVKLSKKTVEETQDAVWTPKTLTEEEQAEAMLINTDSMDERFGSLAIPYTGYTLKPEFQFSSENMDAAQMPVVNELSASDYTVSYSIGRWSEGRASVTATVKGRGNYSGNVKIPDLFTVTARSLKDFSIEVSHVTYSGKALKPAVTFRDKNGKAVDLKLNTAYSVSYENNKAVKSVSGRQPALTVKVKGNGWLTDSGDKATTSRTLNFTIDQAEITGADVSDIVFQTFRGKALKPKVTVKVSGRKLKEGRDYELTYDRNINRSGTRTATVTIKGKGNYFTRRPIEKTFIIK